jgi:hypothetical protein
MSQDPSQQTVHGGVSPSDAQREEQARKQIQQLTEEIAQLSEADIQPAQYFSDVLQRIYFAMQAFAGVMWIRTPQGNLQQQCQINLREVGLEQSPEARPMHDELLRQAVMQSKGGIVQPRFSHNFGSPAEQIAGNATAYFIVLAPIMQDKQVVGLIELFIDPSRPKNALQFAHQFVLRIASFISLFNRNHQLRQMMGQQELWLKLENFSRQIHGSLQMTEVAYLVANEGRRLIDVDRISVATRSSNKCEVTAISGADVVEKRSNLVQLMRALFDAVVEWGEKLVYTGTKDDTLPPKVLDSLDAYLGESNSKVLVVLPLQDEREKEKQAKARSALMMECFESKVQPDQLLARLDVVGRHSASALYNAQEYRRIPMRFLWMPLAYLQDGMGGKTKAITSLVLALVVVLIFAMVFVPFPLKMEVNGQVQPKDRGNLFSTRMAKVVGIAPGLAANSRVSKGQALITLEDPELRKEILGLLNEIEFLDSKLLLGQRQGDPGDRNNDNLAVQEARLNKETKIKLLRELKERNNADIANPGIFTINAPKAGIILSSDFRENLMGRTVRPGDPLLMLGFVGAQTRLSDWEIVLKIPQKHHGQITRAFELNKGKQELIVDVAFVSQMTRSYQAKLPIDKVAPQANAEKDDNNEAESMVLARARVEAKYTITDAVQNSLQSAGVPEFVMKSIVSLKDKQFNGKEIYLKELESLLVQQPAKRLKSVNELDNTIRQLSNEGAPKGLLEKLEALRGKQFDLPGEFAHEVEQIFIDEVYHRYQTRLLEHACRDDIPLSEQIDTALLLSGGEVHTRIRCGNRPMGYSLFYGVWEFAYEKVIFPYFGW